MGRRRLIDSWCSTWGPAEAGLFWRYVCSEEGGAWDGVCWRCVCLGGVRLCGLHDWRSRDVRWNGMRALLWIHGLGKPCLRVCTGCALAVSLSQGAERCV